jgi:hypothetical protein
MAASEKSLRSEIDMLEEVAARVEGRGRPEDHLLLKAITMLIDEKRSQLDNSDGWGTAAP